VNEMGMEEIGIDAGGLFKELWTSLAGVAFNPEYGFFKTTSQGQLYPNPNAAIAMDGLNEDSLFEFLGKVLGKALAEGVVVQPQFARFFLAKLLHKPTHLHDHLPYLDMVTFLEQKLARECGDTSLPLFDRSCTRI
jgi:ubiquitin-protein ligase E3 C